MPFFWIGGKREREREREKERERELFLSFFSLFHPTSTSSPLFLSRTRRRLVSLFFSPSSIIFLLLSSAHQKTNSTKKLSPQPLFFLLSRGKKEKNRQPWPTSPRPRPRRRTSRPASSPREGSTPTPWTRRSRW